ncbi:MAG: hypothetical protein AB7Q23_02560 [Hyphomonadaceae bacterium]
MNADPLLTERLAVAVAVALAIGGGVGAWTAANAVKRAVGVAVALIGAMIGCAGLGAPPALIVAGVGVAFAYVVVAVSLVVRLQEGYGGVEVPEIERAEAEAERAGPPQ